MAHKKSAGTTKNGRDSNPQYLGIKVAHGEKASAGSILVRKRGTDVMPGKNVGMGKDHSLFALAPGVVEIKNKRQVHFDNSIVSKKIVSVK